jgi:hypothetical protein
MAAESLIPPHEVFQVLIESPGVIRQAQLRELTRLRNSGDDWPCFAQLRETLAEQFEGGWLIEMGTIRFYRDHTGTLVISDPTYPVGPNESN